MKILVTGASGYIGEALCRYLSGLDIPVTAIYNAHFPTTLDGLKGITLVQADITKPHSLAGPMSGCTHVFHTAAFCYNWSRDMSVFEKVNIKGTDNLLNMALEHGVKRFVFTSSAGTLGPATDGEAVREGSVRQRAFFNEYERTKYEAELRVLDYLKKGLDAVIVNPTRIFGPGLMGGGNFTTDLIRRYVNGTWHYLPGDGKSTGNYVYVDDVIKGHWLAMQKGRKGERYILGGENMDFISFFNAIEKASGRKRYLIRIPMPAMRAMTFFTSLYSALTQRAPGIMKSDVQRYACNWAFNSDKAGKELSYSPVSTENAMLETVNWLRFGKRKKPYTLITGAASGIGKALAVECASRGFNVLLLARTNSQRLEELTVSLRQRYRVETSNIALDITNPDAADQVAYFLAKHKISINMLINNAGVGNEGRFDQPASPDYLQMIDLNVRALSVFVHRFLPELLAHKKGFLLNVASMAAFQPIPYKAVYAASKAYVHSLTIALHREFKGSMHVSVLCPGAVPTNEQVRTRISRQSGLGKASVTTPEFVAKKAIDGLMQNKAIIIPGVVNKLLLLISRITPLPIRQRTLERTFRK